MISQIYYWQEEVVNKISSVRRSIYIPEDPHVSTILRSSSKQGRLEGKAGAELVPTLVVLP